MAQNPSNSNNLEQLALNGLKVSVKHCAHTNVESNSFLNPVNLRVVLWSLGAGARRRASQFALVTASITQFCRHVNHVVDTFIDRACQPVGRRSTVSAGFKCVIEVVGR